MDPDRHQPRALSAGRHATVRICVARTCRGRRPRTPPAAHVHASTHAAAIQQHVAPPAVAVAQVAQHHGVRVPARSTARAHARPPRGPRPAHSGDARRRSAAPSRHSTSIVTTRTLRIHHPSRRATRTRTVPARRRLSTTSARTARPNRLSTTPAAISASPSTRHKVRRSAHHHHAHRQPALRDRSPPRHEHTQPPSSIPNVRTTAAGPSYHCQARAVVPIAARDQDQVKVEESVGEVFELQSSHVARWIIVRAIEHVVHLSTSCSTDAVDEPTDQGPDEPRSASTTARAPPLPSPSPGDRPHHLAGVIDSYVVTGSGAASARDRGALLRDGAHVVVLEPGPRRARLASTARADDGVGGGAADEAVGEAAADLAERPRRSPGGSTTPRCFATPRCTPRRPRRSSTSSR